MNANDVLLYGHFEVEKAIADLPDDEWETAGVCGYWSVKEIIAHLASFEQILLEIFSGLQDAQAPAPILERFGVDQEKFNDFEVASRKEMSVKEIWQEYETACKKNLNMIAQVSEEERRLKGLLPWYGEKYDLDDFLVYTFYGHKREHCAQISVFKDKLAAKS